jgi:peptidyl-prolyl cis-trans isomerase D
MAKRKKSARLGRVGRVEREQRLNKIVQYSMIGILAVVVVVVAYGIIVSSFVTPNIVLATVFGEEITVEEYQTQVRYQRQMMIDTMEQYASLYQLYTDPTVQQQISNYITQIQYQLEDAEGFGQVIFNQMIDDILIKGEALDRGIEVTEDEIIEEVGNPYGYYPNGYPTPLPTATMEPTDSGDETTSTETVEATPAPLPTSITYEEFQDSLSAELESYREYGVTDEVFYNMVEAQLYRQKLSDVLADGIDNMEDQVWARHILVEDEETAQEVLDRLAEGESFEDLATEYSTDPSAATNFGDLGWFNDSAMIPEFSDAAFNAEVGDIVGPVETTYGFHIIEVLGHEMREMDAADFDYQVSIALADFVSQLKAPAEENGDIVLNPDWAKYIPEDPRSPYATQ